MKIGDLVKGNFYQRIGIITEKRCDIRADILFGALYPRWAQFPLKGKVDGTTILQKNLITDIFCPLQFNQTGYITNITQTVETQ